MNTIYIMIGAIALCVGFAGGMAVNYHHFKNLTKQAKYEATLAEETKEAYEGYNNQLRALINETAEAHDKAQALLDDLHNEAITLKEKGVEVDLSKYVTEYINLTGEENK